MENDDLKYKVTRFARDKNAYLGVFEHVHKDEAHCEHPKNGQKLLFGITRS